MFAHLFKANPYHDSRGRFTDKESAHFVSTTQAFRSFHDRNAKDAAYSKRIDKAHEARRSKLADFDYLGGRKRDIDYNQITNKKLMQEFDLFLYEQRTKGHMTPEETDYVRGDPFAYFDHWGQRFKKFHGVEFDIEHVWNAKKDAPDHEKFKIVNLKQTGRTNEEVRNIAKELGVHPDTEVHVMKDVKTFDFQGMKGEYGGYFKSRVHSRDKKTSFIGIGPQVVESNVRSILAHELTHDAYDRHRNAIGKELAANAQHLADKDGVTQYSRQWWDQVKVGKAEVESAINETFAELSALKEVDKKAYDNADPVWKKLHQTLLAEYKKGTGK